MALFRSNVRKRTRHSLADPAEASAVLAQLPKDDPLASLQALSGYLDWLRATDSLKPIRAFETIDQIDRGARVHYRKLLHGYALGQRRLTKLEEDRLWFTVAGYLAELSQAYRYCISKHQIGANGASALQRLLPLICARALRACGARLKWSYLRYRSIDPGLWAEIVALFLLAESSGFASDDLALYRGAAQNSSAQNEFLKILMLAIAVPGSLLPEQIEVAERLIAQCGDHFVISAHAADTLHHFIDLCSDEGPRKLPTSRKINRDSRAFGACRAIEQLKDQLIRAERGRNPSNELGLSSDFDLETIRATVRHLVRYWERPLPERRSSRERHVARIAVVHDYDEVVANVGGLALEYPFVSEQETWIVENRSRDGLHALVPSPHGRWVRLGSVLAFREDDESAWRPAVVRRIVRDDDDARYVAVETLADGGTAVTVIPGVAAASAESGREGVLCVLLAGRNGVTDEVTLLLPAAAYSSRSPIEMRAYDRRYRLMPVRLAESGDGYRIARFKILQPA